MASAELLKMTHGVDQKVADVDDRVKGVEGQVQDVRSDVRDVGDKVQTVEGRVQDVKGDVQVVGNKIQGVDDKLDQVNSSLFLNPNRHSAAQAPSQGTSSEMIFDDGSLPPIHLSIITLHAKLITEGPPSGFFKVVYSITGNPLAPSCGYTQNVRYS